MAGGAGAGAAGAGAGMAAPPPPMGGGGAGAGGDGGGGMMQALMKMGGGMARSNLPTNFSPTNFLPGQQLATNVMGAASDAFNQSALGRDWRRSPMNGWR